MNASHTPPTSPSFFPELAAYLAHRSSAFDSIPDNRKSDLETLARYIHGQLSKSESAKLTFICTHNSRRSHLSQIWAQVAANYYGLSGIETYSGGTEATAFNPRAVAAMQRCGLRITTDNPEDPNPRYHVLASEDSAPNACFSVCFSKVYDAPPNPTQNYAAVMTCSDADEACPLVMGCDLRIPIRYEDPKVADDTEFEAQRYDERAAQICTEMLYLMSRARLGVS